jgi:hypothetical protein
MFKRNKTEKAPKQNKNIAATVTLQQEYSRQFDELFADIERTTDDAYRVLKLQQLMRDIDNADNHIRILRENIVNNRTATRTLMGGGAGYVAAAAAIAIPGAIVFPPLLPFIGLAGAVGFATGSFPRIGRVKKKSERLVSQNADLSDFQGLIAAKRVQTAVMLDDTIKNCDLEKLPLCPRFEDALMNCIPLREHFTKAATAAAKKTQEEKAAQQKQTPISKRLKISRLPPNA